MERINHSLRNNPLRIARSTRLILGSVQVLPHFQTLPASIIYRAFARCTQPQVLHHDAQFSELSERLPILVYYRLIHYSIRNDFKSLSAWINDKQGLVRPSQHQISK